MLVFVFCVIFVLVVSLARTCCLVVRCWLGCRGRGDRGRGSCWLIVSDAYEVTFHRSSAVVSQVMSLVKSLLSLLDLYGCE